jgi:transporter family protein
MSYVVITLIGTATMAVGMLFFNMATAMISPRVATVVFNVVIVAVALCWTKILGERILPVLKQGTPVWYTLAAGFLFAIGILALAEALARGPATTVVPIWGSYIVVTAILAMIFLDAPMNIAKGIGIGFAFLGIVMISLKG